MLDKIILGIASASIMFLAGCVESEKPAGRATPTALHETARTLTKVAVLPVVNMTPVSNAHIPYNMSDAFTSELLRWGVNRVVRPAEVAEFMRARKIQLRRAEDVVDLAKALGADLIITLQLTEYDPYNPPKVTLAAQVFSTRSRKASQLQDIDALLSSGVPFVINRENNSDWPILAVERTYDASERRTVDELKDFISIHRNKDTSFEDVDAYLNVSAKYFRFVSHRLAREIIESKFVFDADQSAAEESERSAWGKQGLGIDGD